MAERFTIRGADTVARTLQQAGRSLDDLSRANQDAANIIAPAARARAPRVSGALAGATQPAWTNTRAGIQNVLPYFGPIHYGWPERNIAAQPFADEATVATERQWMAVYQQAVQHACDEVKGA